MGVPVLDARRPLVAGRGTGLRRRTGPPRRPGRAATGPRGSAPVRGSVQASSSRRRFATASSALTRPSVTRRRCASTVARTWTSRSSCAAAMSSASWFTRSATSNRPCSTCSVAVRCSQPQQQVRGVDVPGERDGLSEEPLCLRAQALGGRHHGGRRHLVGDAGPVAQLDGDPQRVGAAPGRPVVVPLVPVDLAHVADRQARGLPEPDLLGHLERPPSVGEGGAGARRTTSRPARGCWRRAAGSAVGRPVRRVERLPQVARASSSRRNCRCTSPAWLIAMLTPARSPMSAASARWRSAVVSASA